MPVTMVSMDTERLIAELRLWDDRYREAERVMIEAREKRTELILELVQANVTQTRIAQLLGISTQTVNKIIDRYRKANSSR